MLGDQQAALFGQGCYRPGMVKNTYGTGCFMLMNVGNKPVHSKNGLLSTVAWKLNGQTVYATEGSVFIAGAAIQWLRDGLRFFETSADSETLAASVPDSGGVYVVPAFAGLGAPYWDMYARGGILGITRGTTAEHITRATLEALAYQTRDILEAMQQDSGITLETLRVDGGATQNDFLMQFQADMLNVPVHRAAMAETTVLGAAHMAAVQAGINPPDAINEKGHFRIFLPHMEAEPREKLYTGWKKAVERCLKWEDAQAE
jgi:glycerol kinase